jgi:hypothetical protein
MHRRFAQAGGAMAVHRPDGRSVSAAADLLHIRNRRFTGTKERSAQMNLVCSYAASQQAD